LSLPVGADPLGPDNILGFLTGSLTGTPAIIGSRFVVVAKSPKTAGGWGDANCGGFFGMDFLIEDMKKLSEGD
jgi:aldehyde:ferredoxin oxidoreductase